MSCALPDYTEPQNVIAVFVFSDRGVKMLVKCLQICAHVFIDRPQNCAQTSFRSCAGLRPNFGHSRSKLCPIMCRLRTKLCPNFGRSRARLCPISFAPCPFPNLAGTLERFADQCAVGKGGYVTVCDSGFQAEWARGTVPGGSCSKSHRPFKLIG